MKRCPRILLKPYEVIVFYTGLLWFGLTCLLWSPFAIALRPLLPRKANRWLGRAAIRCIFRVFLTGLQWSGRFRFELKALDALRDEHSLIIAPNHPSLWDAVLIASRLPQVACIMKVDIINNFFLGSGARLAGYIRNEPLRRMVTLAMEELQRGGNLLLFPEGTRTVRGPIGPLSGSLGLIARRADAAIQTVFIETDSPFLSKGWPVYKKPRLPMTYRVRLGRRFEPHEFDDDFMSTLEQYFIRELSATASPAHPDETDVPPAALVRTASGSPPQNAAKPTSPQRQATMVD